MIGKTTVGGLQSGVVYGFAGQVDGIVARDPRRARAPRRTVVATGGLVELDRAAHRARSRVVDPYLTLDGLRLVWELNA